MADETDDRRATLQALFNKDLERDAIRRKEEYLKLFPELEREIDALLRSSCTSDSSTTEGAIRAPEMTAASTSSKQTVGKYRLIRVLGQGGQGVVYEAEDEQLRRRVALKILPLHHRLTEERRLRLEREATAVAQLEHSGFPRVYDHGEYEGVLYMAMEYVRGRTLAAVIASRTRAACDEETSRLRPVESSPEAGERRHPRTRSLPAVESGVELIREDVRLAIAVARALHVAHAAGLVHRDIKPGNIIVRDDGSPCVLDFGLASADSSDGPSLTQTGDVMGTPSYMSPEQTRGAANLDRRTDVYSLGVCLFEACTLQKPFKAATTRELFELIETMEPPSPRRSNPRFPKDLEAIILTALDKDPDRRFSTAADFADDLERFLERRPVQARPSGLWIRSQRWVQRNRIATILGSLVILALACASVVFYTKERSAQRALGREQKALAAANRERQAKEAALAEKTAALEAAERERDWKQEALDDYDRLADVKRLEAAIAASETLYPPSPELVPLLVAWQEEHDQLAGRLADHLAYLEELRAQALPYADDDRRRDFAAELAEIPQAKEALGKLDKAISEAGEDDAKKKPLVDHREQVAKRLAELEELTTSGRRSWRFADQTLQFQHDVLAELVGDLRIFAEDARGPVKSIAARLEQSRTIAQETLEGEIAARWIACRERIADKKEIYADLDLAPQLGLIPLGPDPDSKLEEFLHWLTHEGAIPERDAETGKIAVTEELGVVLVLIPGGTFLMGSQKDDPAKPNFDRESKAYEQPVNEVTLLAYFLSKYEMTQAQWRRAFQANPSEFGPGAINAALRAPVDARHPVERVSWEEAQVFLPRVDLQLPTEAEWEQAARGGRTDQVYAGCSKISELRRIANINGSETRAVRWSNQQPGHRDDWIIHAPVGSFAANTFGLHDMTGNVWEWCLDGSSDSYIGAPGARGLRGDPGASTLRVFRGGSFDDSAGYARVAFRTYEAPSTRSHNVGLRPARIIP
ncbi:MAG: SUMF1/EgtB/PvdO family nonheme iron enzyme [Planctomycetes bacterium]|nr:SUMF1/EgtB/PvdO family nonheme iron enzyme [Planctomycetota bacterium]